MGYIYTGQEPTESGEPQVIYSETEVEYLEGTASWVRTEGEAPEGASILGKAPEAGPQGPPPSEQPKVETIMAPEERFGVLEVPETEEPDFTEPEPEPVASAPIEKPAANANKPEWVAYAESLGVETDGLTVDQLKDAVEAKESESD